MEIRILASYMLIWFSYQMSTALQYTCFVVTLSMVLNLIYINPNLTSICTVPACDLSFPDMSFAAFVQSLIAASERYQRLQPIENILVGMIERYQDCVKACEHQHSKRANDRPSYCEHQLRKRANERTSDSFIRPNICKFKCIWYTTVNGDSDASIARYSIPNAIPFLKFQNAKLLSVIIHL